MEKEMKKTYRKMDVAVGIIAGHIDGAECILAQKKGMGYPWNPGKWCLPGGKINDNEEPETALLRELTEEFKYDFTRARYLFDNSFTDKLQKESELIIRTGVQKVFALPFTGDISDLTISEGVGLAFLSRTEIDLYPFIPHDKMALEKYFFRIYQESLGK
jgi:8-oxo-dGTP pyrophosphatase MutT (NUDIX family)